MHCYTAEVYTGVSTRGYPAAGCRHSHGRQPRYARPRMFASVAMSRRQAACSSSVRGTPPLGASAARLFCAASPRTSACLWAQRFDLQCSSSGLDTSIYRMSLACTHGRKTTMEAGDMRKRPREHGGTSNIGSADVSQMKAHLQAVPVLFAGVARCQLFDEDICGVLASQLAGDDANLQSLHKSQCRCSCKHAEQAQHTSHVKLMCLGVCRVLHAQSNPVCTYIRSCLKALLIKNA